VRQAASLMLGDE